MTQHAYHHGNLREEIVRTAVALAREKGGDGVALREVARRTGVSHNAAYRHFADREALLAEVAWAGLTELGEAMVEQMGEHPGSTPADRARRRLRELGRAYVQFALREPGLFRVAFSEPIEPDRKDPGGPYAMLGQALDEMVTTGAMDPVRRPEAEIACWSTVHGFAMLNLDGPLRLIPDGEREVLLEIALDAIERGLGES